MTRTRREQAWVTWAMGLIAADFRRSSDTHMLPIHLPACPGIKLYLKDESSHITGSLKHRLARALYLYALANGYLSQDKLVVEASSGSTAISEAYFARMLGTPFVAVMPASTSREKIALIESYGGRCHLVDNPKTVYAAAAAVAAEAGGHYMDQFTFAERATDWRGNNNIAESIFEQMGHERHPVPTWVVVGAGTGGTSATIGRFVRYRALSTKVAVVDPENSAFLMAFQERSTEGARGSRIEGIGRPRVEPSFLPTVVDRMIGIPDAASIAAMRYLQDRTGIRAGGSTGTNLYGSLRIACEMRAAGQPGSIVTLMCDARERYAQTYADDGWLASQGLDLEPYLEVLDRAWTTGEWTG